MSQGELTGRGLVDVNVGDVVEVFEDPYGLEKHPPSLGLGLVVEPIVVDDPGWGPAWKVLMSNGDMEIHWEFNVAVRSFPPPRKEEANHDA